MFAITINKKKEREHNKAASESHFMKMFLFIFLALFYFLIYKAVVIIEEQINLYTFEFRIGGAESEKKLKLKRCKEVFFDIQTAHTVHWCQMSEKEKNYSKTVERNPKDGIN